MPRSGGVYSKPAGTTAVANTTIESSKFNQLMDDIVTDLNDPRPVTAGGTGAATASAARTALAVPGKSANETIDGDWTFTAAPDLPAFTTRPVNISTGGIWTKDNGGGSYSLMLYDGAEDIEIGGLLDEDDFASDSNEAAPSQQSVKAYLLGIAGDPKDKTADRSTNTSYQATDGPLEVTVIGRASNSTTMEVSSDNSTWVEKGFFPGNSEFTSNTFTVPYNWYWRINGSGITISRVYEVVLWQA